MYFATVYSKMDSVDQPQKISIKLFIGKSKVDAPIHIFVIINVMLYSSLHTPAVSLCKRLPLAGCLN